MWHRQTPLIYQQQLKDGADDLNFRLSHFRKRVADKDKDKYDQFFFGKKMSNLEKTKGSCIEGIVLFQQEKKENTHISNKNKEKWLKAIYRKIISSTHPDKFKNFPVESLKQKYLKIYLKAVNAWNKDENDQVLLFDVFQ